MYCIGNTGIKKIAIDRKAKEMIKFKKDSEIPRGISLYCFLLWMKSLYSAKPKVGPATQPAKK